jgi:GTPase Era involved in 16S rRNA processing
MLRARDDNLGRMLRHDHGRHPEGQVTDVHEHFISAELVRE